MSATLYLVPTPIGNLADMTLRAIEVLKAVDLVLAEDTRVSQKLLHHYQIQKPMWAYHEHNEANMIPKVVGELMKNKAVAVITDAGTPGISDPAFELVREVIKKDLPVVPLPGATALIPALVASGLPTDSFVFLGFLPKKDSARKEMLAELTSQKRTLIFYESPYRVVETLREMAAVWGNRQVCLARDISKKYEEFVRVSLPEAVTKFAGEKFLGEVVLVVEGAGKNEARWDETEVAAQLRKRIDSGDKLTVVAKELAKESGWSKSQIYLLGIGHEN